MKKKFIPIVLLTGVAGLAGAQGNQPTDADFFAEALNETPTPRSLAWLHEHLASEPHIAGTPGDQRTIDRIAALFESYGLVVRRQPVWAYLSYPVSAGVQVLGDEPDPIDLSLSEPPVEGDAHTAHPDLTFGWNGYAGTGDVTGEVVYVNYARLEDFQALANAGIDCRGKIVIARYGGNYRGFKARFAEQAGAAGLIIYTDPADAGYVRGVPYPRGGWANPHSIQRGSITTLKYPGDPLTPFIPATEDAMRLDPDDVDLPHIPVQPMGWQSAHEILSRMQGDPAPRSWQGGLPITYRTLGGSDLRVRMKVEQQRRIVRTENVIAEIRGSTWPDEIILVGCHHDAWGFGAADPLAGLICVMESARSFASLAQEGWLPARTIRFAAWAAEEHGIVGSTEYVEQFREELTDKAVAYINLDMAAMGPHFGAAGEPSLAPAITEAARSVPQAGDPDISVFERWSGNFPASDPKIMSLGELGGGSDHVGFNAHLCVPSAGFHAGGSDGTSYHSNYDTVAWYRKVVGGDYEPAMMITRMTNATIAQLAQPQILPLDPSRYAAATRRYVDDIAAITARSKAFGDTRPNALDRVSASAELFRLHAEPIMHRLAAAEDIEPERAAAINSRLMQIERAWCDAGFETGRSWYRSGFGGPDQSSGYAAWMLPALRHAVSLDDPVLLDERANAYERFFARATELIEQAGRLLP